MKPRNDLTAEYVRSILDYNEKTCEFRWKVNLRNKVKAGAVAIGIGGRLYKTHRLAHLIQTGEWPETINERRHRKATKIWCGRKSEIERLYVNGTWSQRQLAVYYGMSQSGITLVLRRLGIPAKPRSREGGQNGRFKDGTQSTIYRQMIEKDCCAKCGIADDLCIHHKDENHINNSVENLEVLCMSCHSRMHKQAWWDARL